MTDLVKPVNRIAVSRTVVMVRAKLKCGLVGFVSRLSVKASMVLISIISTIGPCVRMCGLSPWIVLYRVGSTGVAFSGVWPCPTILAPTDDLLGV